MNGPSTNSSGSPKKRIQIGTVLLILGGILFIGQLENCGKGDASVMSVLVPSAMLYIGYKLVRSKPKSGNPILEPPRPEPPPEPLTPPAPSPAPDPTPAEPQTPSLRRMILLIDGGATISQAVRLGLSNVDMGLRACNPNDNILNLMHRLMPAVVMMKLDQLGNTLHLARKIRSKVEFNPIRLILMYGEENRLSPDEAQQAGVDAILPVPFESQDLLAALGLEPAIHMVKGKPVVTIFTRTKPRPSAAAGAAAAAQPHQIYTQPTPIIYEPPPVKTSPTEVNKPSPIKTAAAEAPPIEEPQPSPAEAASQPPEPEVADEPEPAYRPNTRLLLLVDNGKAMQKQVRAALPADQWSIRICADGRLALEMALEQKPAAVLCRREAAGQAGIDVIRYIKEQRALAGVRCVIIIGESEILDEFQAQMAGVDVVLKHPFIDSDLQQALEK